jgi:raffinose/stachyose/melibiose transport system substrate-binding protein
VIGLKKIYSKIFIILGLSISLTLGIMGCGNGAGVHQGFGEEQDDVIELVLWSIATETDAFHQSYLNAIAAFEEANPGVRIRFETFDNESYKTKIRLAVATNELPDIFFTWGGGFSRPFVNSGKVLPLDEVFKEFSEELDINVLNNVIFDGSIYGSVTTTPISVMFYNRSIFAEHGLEAPQTWEELVHVCQVLLDGGVTPMGISAKDSWVLAMLFDGIALKTVGPDQFYQVLAEGEGDFDSEYFLKAARLFRDLVEMGVFVERANFISNDEASAHFFDGDVAMFTTGSWMAGSIQTDADDPEDFGVFPIPVINADYAVITDFMGGGSDTLMVAATTNHPQLAKQATFQLTRSVSRYAYLDGAGIPAWSIDFDDSLVNPLTRQVADFAATATSFTLWADTLMEADDASVYLTLLQELYLGEIEPEEFVRAMAIQLNR